MASPAQTTSPPRRRIRDVLPGIRIGAHPPGPLNALTDVPGVLVSTESIRSGDGSVNTGVTTILPRRDFLDRACHAGLFRFNGAGEMTGSHWIEEAGLLNSPVVLTNSFSIGLAYQGVYEWCIKHQVGPDRTADFFILPVVAETWDGHLSDQTAFAVRPEHVVRGIERAAPGPVAEGNAGDIFLAFSTASELPIQTSTPGTPGSDPNVATALAVEVVDDNNTNALFEAAADATEEAIYNALCMAETMTGFQGKTVEALDLERLEEIMEKYM